MDMADDYWAPRRDKKRPQTLYLTDLSRGATVVNGDPRPPSAGTTVVNGDPRPTPAGTRKPDFIVDVLYGPMPLFLKSPC